MKIRLTPVVSGLLQGNHQIEEIVDQRECQKMEESLLLTTEWDKLWRMYPESGYPVSGHYLGA